LSTQKLHWILIENTWGVDIITAAIHTIDDATEGLNRVYNTNSQTGVTFQLAACYQTNYVESTDRSDCPGDWCGWNAFSDDLGTFPTLTEVQNRRDETAADINNLTVYQEGTGVQGMANIYGAFNVTNAGGIVYMAPFYIVPHEIGHSYGCVDCMVMGCNNGPETGYWDPLDRFGTVMSYHGTERLGYFSGTYTTHPTLGVPIGDVDHNCRDQIVSYRNTPPTLRNAQNNLSLPNLTIHNDEWYDAIAQTTLDASNGFTLNSGGTASLRCNGSITIGSGFQINSGSTLTIRSGSGAINKRGVIQQKINNGIEPLLAITPDKLLCKIVKTGQYFLLQYSLPFTAKTSIKIYTLNGDVVYKEDLGVKQTGFHKENLSFDKLISKVYILQMKANNKTISTYFNKTM
jgi:hypothetical protein